MVHLPVNVFPPLYLKFLTASSSWSLAVKLLSCHSVRGSPLYWVRPGTKTYHYTRLSFEVQVRKCKSIVIQEPSFKRDSSPKIISPSQRIAEKLNTLKKDSFFGNVV